MAKRKLDEREFVEKFSYHARSEGSMEVNGKVRHGCMFNLDKITDDEVAYLKSFCNVRLTSWQYRWAPEIKGPAVFIAYDGGRSMIVKKNIHGTWVIWGDIGVRQYYYCTKREAKARYRTECRKAEIIYLLQRIARR